jgi:N6-adenosine-specific RNA methylase IME4
MTVSLSATVHPAAELFPMMEGEAFDALVEDIKKHGLRMPIVQIKNAILDGRNRYRACLLAGVDVRTEEFTGTDPVAYVISANLQRRHLDASQRSMVASRLANLPRGRPWPSNTPKDTFTQPEAAKVLNVSHRSVVRAANVQSLGVPELVGMVDRGELAVAVADKIAKMPHEEQTRVIQEAGEDTKSLKGVAKKVVRQGRETALAEKIEVASKTIGHQTYGVIYADPPWQFEPYSRETGMDRAADNHYPTMNIDAICDLSNRIPAAPDCVLFLWATAPMLVAGIDVMSEWGFTYKSHVVWAKPNAGTGYWFRSKHEILLVGTRGNIPAPAPGSQFPSIIEAPTTKHSEKPSDFREMIETMFPQLPRVEMFAREAATGWDAWGAEAPVG